MLQNIGTAIIIHLGGRGLCSSSIAFQCLVIYLSIKVVDASPIMIVAIIVYRTYNDIILKMKKHAATMYNKVMELNEYSAMLKCV